MRGSIFADRSSPTLRDPIQFRAGLPCPLLTPPLCTTLGLCECACQTAEVSDASDLNLVHACPEIGTQAVSTLPQQTPVVSEVVKDLDDLWEVKLWRNTPVAMERFGQIAPHRMLNA